MGFNVSQWGLPQWSLWHTSVHKFLLSIFSDSTLQKYSWVRLQMLLEGSSIEIRWYRNGATNVLDKSNLARGHISGRAAWSPIHEIRMLLRKSYLTWFQCCGIHMCSLFCDLFAKPKPEVRCKDKIRHVVGWAQVQPRYNIDVGSWIDTVDPKTVMFFPQRYLMKGKGNRAPKSFEGLRICGEDTAA